MKTGERGKKVKFYNELKDYKTIFDSNENFKK